MFLVRVVGGLARLGRESEVISTSELRLLGGRGIRRGWRGEPEGIPGGWWREGLCTLPNVLGVNVPEVYIEESPNARTIV